MRPSAMSWRPGAIRLDAPTAGPGRSHPTLRGRFARDGDVRGRKTRYIVIREKGIIAGRPSMAVDLAGFVPKALAGGIRDGDSEGRVQRTRLGGVQAGRITW